MTLNQLKYAVALQKQGSFKHAAHRLGISQPALSLQIQNLEEEVEIKLFDRSSSPVSPTVDGKEFLKRAQQIITQCQSLSNFSERLTKDFSGTLNVGIIPTLAPFLLPLFISSLQADYPHFKLDFHERLTKDIVKAVKTGDLDVGIISTPVVSAGIECIPLFYEKFYIYTSDAKASNPFTLENVDHSQLWLLDEGNCFRDQVNNFCNIREIMSRKNFIYRTNSIDALIKIVDNKGGITILPELSTISLNEEQEGRLKEIGKVPKAREIGMVVTPHYDKKRFIDKLKHYISGNVPKHMLYWQEYDVIEPLIEIT